MKLKASMRLEAAKGVGVRRGSPLKQVGFPNIVSKKKWCIAGVFCSLCKAICNDFL